MNDKDTEMFNEVFTRLRETEAQTREQCVQIKSLCSRIDNFTVVTDKFFELEDKRHQADEIRYKLQLEHESHRDARTEEREKKFWSAITLLLGAVVALALGPKLAKEIYSAFTSGDKKSSISLMEPWYNSDRRYLDVIPMKENDFLI